MAIYQVSFEAPDETCIFVNPRVGSLSMTTALHRVNHSIITLEEAQELPNRVMFMRHPIERLDSLFGRFYALALNSSKFSEFMPEGTIKAHGARVAGLVGNNDQHWKGSKITDFQERLAAKRDQGPISNADLARWLDNGDFRRLVKYILEKDKDGNYKNNDPHWGNQVDLCSLNGEFIPNIVHKFDTEENIAIHWAKYVNEPITRIRPSLPIDHEEYLLEELKTYYAKDIQKWGQINA